jgi:hypothetical protein
VAVRMTLTALPIRTAARFSPLGPLDIRDPHDIHHKIREANQE